jgi:glycerate 2-kinase
LLLRCGAEIHEINAVRKHLSKIKGGQLGNFYSPTKVISLIISDVIGNDLDVIASGPTFPDSSTFQDAYRVLEKYNLVAKAPESIVAYLKRGCRGEVAETPKTLTNCENIIVGDNRLALETMAKKAEEQGFTSCIVTFEQKGDTAEVARTRVSEVIEGKYKDHTALLIGGETTPKLPQNAGKGGRNQHYAAASMLAMKTYHGRWVIASVGTDGSDYLPDVAGAIVDNNTLDRAIAQRLDVQTYIDKYDSYTLFQKLGSSLIVTGSTGTNVSDIMLYLLTPYPTLYNEQ